MCASDCSSESVDFCLYNQDQLTLIFSVLDFMCHYLTPVTSFKLNLSFHNLHSDNLGVVKKDY